MRRKNIIIASFVVLILVAAGWGVILYKLWDHKVKDDYYGNSLEMDIPDFTLTDQNGNKVSLSDFRGEPVFLFFGYTHCPDICPVTLSVLNGVSKEVGEAEKDKFKVLFVTIDPERDDPEALRNYVPYFNESFTGLTGTPDEIKKVANSFRAFYMKEESDSKAGYLMGHTSAVYLLDKNGKVVLRYPQDKMDPKSIAGDLKKIL
ncbi:MAG TPA: SCO family protein [Thermodesulfobacteriota bacterium]|nr:SCO family protein [Thermodesulfobacteriota bacterium]